MKIIDLENLQIYDEELKEYIKQLVKESSDAIVVSEDSFLKFPTLGNEYRIYIDTTTNKIYRWSEAELKYYIIGSDYNDISIINGNF